ncbi:uncharacterized protein LOC128733186 [Sabethes cyaneus]|uniref:uncharacterized protein LOC128733186 n=1 Tax=Sabethes cyaneus TaxID=53552 RepID=UPI00237D77AE|nr:uncharacterized protein LOC128733186 [Sabethes cyaneus]
MSKSPPSETTSETQSVSDESITASNANLAPLSTKSNAATKSGKKSVPKEDPKERPPWRAASVSSVLPKKDLRARILDASKRLRRANVSVQTDPTPTKLMKEASTDEQEDLITMKDEEILTDGNLVVKEVGNLIFTHSVAQMTDTVQTINAATQTALPRSAVSFRKFLEAGERDGQNSNSGSEEAPAELVREYSCFEELLKIDKQIKQFFDNELDILEVPDIPEDNASGLGDDNSKDKNTPDLLAMSSQETGQHKPRLAEPSTYSSWQSLDFSDEELESYVPRELPRRTIGEGDQPWAKFKDLVIGSRVVNMRLSPIPARKPKTNNKKSVTWSDAQHRAVSDLLHEATALVDIFDQVSMLLGPDIKLHTIPVAEDDFNLPPPKWEPLLTKSCHILEEKLAKVRHLNCDDLDEQLRSPKQTQPVIDIEVSL